MKDLHPAMKDGFAKLYGWTNDADGIRHGGINEPKSDFDTAKYFYVSSCAFINFLAAKYSDKL